MDPLVVLRKCLKQEGSTITLHDHSGQQVPEVSQCVYIKLGSFIFSRDVPTNFRSKRGAGDFYPLDAVWFMMLQKDGSYGEYMQEARKSGVSVISLVDRKDLIFYLEEEQRPEECPFVDSTAAPLPIPRRSFSIEEPTFEEKNVEDTPITLNSNHQTTPLVGRKVKVRPAKSRDAVFFSSGKDFTNIMELAKEVQKTLTEATLPQPPPPPSSSTIPPVPKQPVSLIEQIASANRPTSIARTMTLATPTRTSSSSTTSSAAAIKDFPSTLKANFTPIIIVPAAPTATLTMYNAQEFLSNGRFIPTGEVKSQGRSKENIILFDQKICGRILKIQLVDNPTRLPTDDWRRVMAVFVQGNTWQFKGWKWESPVELFQNVKGFFLDFDDSKPDPNIFNWNVQRLTINRSRRHLDSTAVFQFWASLEEHLKARHLLLN